jgi:hypothetical protein
MKINHFTLIISLVIINLVCNSCEPFFKPAPPPGISIYKTNGDYFDLVTIGMKEDRIFRTSTFSGEMNWFDIAGGDTIYKFRIKLANDYILDFNADSRYDVFLDITFKQHMALEMIYPRGIPHEILASHILDKSPYSVYYRDTAEPRRFGYTLDMVDTSDINQIIREGKLDQFFEKLR